MVEGKKAAIQFFVSHQQFAEAVEPTVRYFYNPAPDFFLGVTLEFAGLFSSLFDVRYLAVFFDDLQGRRSCVARVGTQVLVAPEREIGFLNHDGIEHSLQLRHIMPVGSCHDERQRDAISVHQKMALAPIFFPDLSGWVRRFAVPVALSSSPRQYFAIAGRCLQTRRTRQGPTATEPQRLPPSPTLGNARVLHWQPVRST